MIVGCFLKPVDIARLGKVLDLVEAAVGAGDRRETWSVDQRGVGGQYHRIHVQQRRWDVRCPPILLASMKKARIPTLARPCTILVSRNTIWKRAREDADGRCRQRKYQVQKSWRQDKEYTYRILCVKRVC